MKSKGLWYSGILGLMLVFILLVFALYRMQQSVGYVHQDRVLSLVEPESFAQASHLVEQEPTCLLLWDDDPESVAAKDLMEDVFDQIKVPYESLNAGAPLGYDFEDYDSVVLCLSSVTSLSAKMIKLMDWTHDGGKVMFAFLPWNEPVFTMLFNDLGIKSIGDSMCVVNALHFTKPLMLGGEARDFRIMDAYESSASVLLEDGCDVYMESDGNAPVPLVWKRKIGDGDAVMVNLDFFDKAYRGIYCAAYSLLGDAFAWPVINSSTFYLDDFPSPVPMGDSEFISRDYGMSIDDFMRRVWWEDIQKLAQEHGIRFTGMVIEDYSDQVEGDFPANSSYARHQYFGNTLLNKGGEIGFHGYNHMPLVLGNFDYGDEFTSYRKWKDEASMKASIQELNRFCENLYPQESFQVYVPPSNILSAEGRAMLSAEFPNIKAIASTYFDDFAVYEQEFEVADDGIVETPRVISGCEMNDYTRMAAMMELTFHYVNTHFLHPDDVLDVDRGASLGWGEMYARLSEYADWLYDAAPNIRNLTGSELAGAVQRYDAIEVAQRVEGDTMTIELGGFVDEAYLLLRVNGKTPGQVRGGELEKVVDGLYLLRADEANVQIGLGA